MLPGLLGLADRPGLALHSLVLLPGQHPVPHHRRKASRCDRGEWGADPLPPHVAPVPSHVCRSVLLIPVSSSYSPGSLDPMAGPPILFGVGNGP